MHICPWVILVTLVNLVKNILGWEYLENGFFSAKQIELGWSRRAEGESWETPLSWGKVQQKMRISTKDEIHFPIGSPLSPLGCHRIICIRHLQMSGSWNKMINPTYVQFMSRNSSNKYQVQGDTQRIAVWGNWRADIGVGEAAFADKDVGCTYAT